MTTADPISGAGEVTIFSSSSSPSFVAALPVILVRPSLVGNPSSMGREMERRRGGSGGDEVKQEIEEGGRAATRDR